MFYNYENLNLKDEIWKDVVGWEEFYEVSNIGRVKAKERVIEYVPFYNNAKVKRKISEKIRKPKLNKHTGYLMVGLNGKGISVNVTIHSMVAKTFIKNFISGKKGNDYCVNHKNGIKIDNRVENLEVITIKENIRHMFKNNLTTSNHKVVFNNVEYYSKAELRRCLKISEKKMNKLISEGDIKIL